MPSTQTEPGGIPRREALCITLMHLRKLAGGGRFPRHRPEVKQAPFPVFISTTTAAAATTGGHSSSSSRSDNNSSLFWSQKERETPEEDFLHWRPYHHPFLPYSTLYSPSYHCTLLHYPEGGEKQSLAQTDRDGATTIRSTLDPIRSSSLHSTCFNGRERCYATHT